jgi:CRISPR type III-A-associated protein Csm2
MENRNDRKNGGMSHNIDSQTQRLLEDYIINGNLGDNGILFSEKGPSNEEGPLKSVSKNINISQIRKFYSEILNIEDLAHIYLSSSQKINQKDFEKLRIKFALLEPLAYYSVMRQPNLEPIGLIIVDAIKKINNEKDNQKWLEKFERFKQVFEVIVAYSKNKGEKNE